MMFGTMKLLGSTKSKITEDKIVKNVLYLEITEVATVHCDIVNNDYQESSIDLFPIIVWSIIGYFTQNFIFKITFNFEYLHIKVQYNSLIQILNC